MTALVAGLSIGLAAGLSPGPLLFLTITFALRDGARAGVLVALAPLLSDLVVVSITLALLGRLPGSVLDLLGILGGLFVAWTGVQSFRAAGQATLTRHGAGRVTARRALGQGTLVNLLSPHPWLTWSAALGPLTVTTWRAKPLAAAALVGGFYFCLVGAKVAVALAVARGRHRLTDALYRRLLSATSGLLVAVGVVMVAEFGSRVLRSS